MIEKEYIKQVKKYIDIPVNLRETYESGLKEVSDIRETMRLLSYKICEIKPGKDPLTETVTYLDQNYTIDGLLFIYKYIRSYIDSAIKDIDGNLFDIPKEVLPYRIHLIIGDVTPFGFGYTPEEVWEPSSFWASFTFDNQTLPFWREASTLYHEVFPGHHLQVRIADLKKDEGFETAHGEGWGLYAERLMWEQGFFTDKALEFGFWLCQLLRASRIVTDIGFHLGYSDESGNPWSKESVIEYLIKVTLLEQEYSNSLADSMIKEPARAICYKIGEGVWLQCRADAMERLGDKFSLKSFHNYALSLGNLSLATLQTKLSEWDGS